MAEIEVLEVVLVNEDEIDVSEIGVDNIVVVGPLDINLF